MTLKYMLKGFNNTKGCTEELKDNAYHNTNMDDKVVILHTKYMFMCIYETNLV